MQRRRHRHLLVLALCGLAPLAALALPGCGGGGSAPAAAPGSPAGTPLGLVAATVSTTVPVTFTNPLAEAATLTELSATGGFSIDPADLPAALPASGEVTLGVRVLPQAQGVVTGTVRVQLAGATGSQVETRAFSATAETVAWSVLTATLDFGTVAVGDSADLLARFRNESTLSPVTLTAANFPSSAFKVVGAPFPLTVQPGEAGLLTVRFEPSEPGLESGTANIGPNDVGGTVPIPLLGTAPGRPSEIVTDFGTRTITGVTTARLTVTVPANAISLTLEGFGAEGNTFGLGELIGPDGTVYENTALTGAYIWQPGAEVFSTTVPNTDRPAVQLVPGGGDYEFRIRRQSGSATTVQVRAIVEVRDDGPDSLLDLNIWLADGLAVDAAGAPSDTRLQAILSQLDSILGQRSIRLGDIAYYDVSDPAYDDVTSVGEFSDLLRTTSTASATRLNLFFVETAFGGGVVGVSATVSGPKRNGTTLSGVMSIYAGFSTNVIGLIAAHEVGHFLGLFHTAEENGDNDFIDDTADCPGSGTSTACPTEGGDLLMHWQAVGGTDLTAGQGLVLRAHPLMRPAPASGTTKPTPLASPRMSLWDWMQIGTLERGWCGCPGCQDSKR